MKLASRDYDPRSDFESVRQFLIATHEVTHSLQNWPPDRFENSHTEWAKDIRIWERKNKGTKPEIVGIANPESPRAYYIQIHPDYRSLEREIIEWIEEHRISNKENPNKKENLYLFSIKGDDRRETLLRDLGYENCGIHAYHRSRPVDLPISTVSIPKDFIIRNIRGKEDYRQLTEAIKVVFGHDLCTEEFYENVIAKASFYVQNLDIVAVAPNGTFAAFCTIRLDPVSKIASLEPLGVHPNYRRRGLARAIIFEALKRTQRYKPAAFIISGAANTPEANQFYDSIGYFEKIEEYYWRKEI
ncbi:MAG: GNAT family N-acetyltransferase [Candidatus Thorarchaeota archaeon]